ncbi:MAG: hypothetical protein M1834_002982 [Cirrosporium novae-zelandiae]|nr:MAG: hypothetical protein M1834_002982 [Cirrosporium novae-zelandiae]
MSGQQPPRRGRRPSSTGRGGASQDHRNGGAEGPASHMTLAAKFEDERARIVSSCFSKVDESGDSTESYLTHLRITEDAAFPAAPPPPESPAGNKKRRIIIIAVRKSGRVRVHKGRENPNGSFSIGKTWVLDDLSLIESFTGLAPSNVDEENRKQWAGAVGFMVTLGKSYYWQANSAKEKDFFISSLVNIYRKYTGGKAPQLTGFQPHELERLIGPPSRNRPSNGSNAIPAQGSRPPSAQGANPVPASVPAIPGRRDQSREPRREPRGRPSYEQFGRPSLERAQRGPGYDSQTSQEDFRKVAPAPLSTSRPQTPSNLAASINGTGPSPAPSPIPSIPDKQRRNVTGGQSVDSFTSQLSNSSGGKLSGPGAERLRPNGNVPDSSDRYASTQRPRSPDPTYRSRSRDPMSRSRPTTPTAARPDMMPPPERKRPPLPVSSISQKGTGYDTDPRFFSPTESPGSRRNDDVRAPSRGSQRSGTAGFGPGPKKPTEDSSQADVKTPIEQSESPTTFSPPVPNPIAGPPISPQKTAEPGPTEEEKVHRPGLGPMIRKKSQPEPPPVEEDGDDDEDGHRPGLGPMIKKKSQKDIANKFRKAAAAASLMSNFKPRAGGAGQRLMASKEKASNEPDGITGVVPAPSLLRAMSSDSSKSALPDPTVKEDVPEAKKSLPQLQVSSPNNKALPEPEQEERPRAESPDDRSRSRSPANAEERRRKRRSDHTPKYAAALGIDVRPLKRKGLEIDAIFSEFGWEGDATREKKVDDLEADLRREIGKVEVGSWLGHFEQNDTRVNAVAKLLDDAIAECEELDGLLTLYNLELNTMADDVAFIEAQGQGLQVQTANQKLLQAELRSLLETLSLSSSDLRHLREVSLNSIDGVQVAETSLCMIYKAMLTMDPALRQGGHTAADDLHRESIMNQSNQEVSSMRAVQEKKENYKSESVMFLGRLKQYMAIAFRAAEQKTMDSLTQSRNANLNKLSTKFDHHAHDPARQDLWPYHALMLFARVMEPFEWDDLIRAYEQASKAPYQEEVRNNEMAWKKMIRKATGEEQDILFTAPEKESNDIAQAARKLTVKRGKTLRATLGSRTTTGETHDGRLFSFEAMQGLLDEVVPLIFTEQNFILEFFHATSLENLDFADTVAAVPPNSRTLPNLSSRKQVDPDKEKSKRVLRAMEEIFSFWPTGMQNFVDYTLKSDPLQGVGVLYHIERKLAELEETNQEFLIKTLQTLQNRLEGLFRRFVDEQIKGIEDTKVKIKKRKGVIAFMRVFPNFSSAVENMIPTPPNNVDQLDIRFLVNESYGKINKAMFESLKFIAKESPAVSHGLSTQGSGDPEDKEVLNYHILLIENMNHYLEEVDTRGNTVLEEWRERAEQELSEHLGLYLDAVIRRPLGKSLDFLESTESLLKSGTPPSSIASRASHSRATFKKLLAVNDSKELRRGVDALRKRMEKHLGEGDEIGLSRNLITKVWTEAERRYQAIGERVQKIAAEVYPEEVIVGWSSEDMLIPFKK